MNPIKPISNKLRQYRKLAGLRQIDVACKLGFTTTDRISRWEKGLAYPHMVNLLKLSVIYGVQPEMLYADLLQELVDGSALSLSPGGRNMLLRGLGRDS